LRFVFCKSRLVNSMKPDALHSLCSRKTSLTGVNNHYTLSTEALLKCSHVATIYKWIPSICQSIMKLQVHPSDVPGLCRKWFRNWVVGPPLHHLGTPLKSPTNPAVEALEIWYLFRSSPHFSPTYHMPRSAINWSDSFMAPLKKWPKINIGNWGSTVISPWNKWPWNKLKSITIQSFFVAHVGIYPHPIPVVWSNPRIKRRRGPMVKWDLWYTERRRFGVANVRNLAA